MSDEDDKVREFVRKVFSPDWSHTLGQKIGETVKAHTSDSFRERASQAARSYVDHVDPAAAHARQDEEIAENQRKLDIAKRYSQPRDGGEIDAPQEPVRRQPVMQEREFSNDADKDAYIERVRRAQAAAGRK